MSIQEILFHSQNKKYPDIVTMPGEIQNIVPATTDDGTEIFKFIRPNLAGNIDPNTGNAFGEVSAVFKSDIEEYSQKNFGHSLPERIAPHEFSRRTPGLIGQMDAPSGAIDPIYTSRPNGIHINHGWKIHADFVRDMTREQGLATIGRGDDYSIVDQKLAGQFDERLSKLGINSEDFYKFYKTMGVDGSYANPNDVISMAETFDRNNMKYKMGIAQYGEGRHVTAYPQNIVDRDKIIKDLEDTMGTRLVDQNDAAYRRSIGITGVKNHPLSRGVSGRFTTDYLDINPNTGQVDFSLSKEGGAIPEEYRITGTITPEQIERINKVTAEMPDMANLLHGPDGYISPYKTIEQIAEERSTGKIATSYLAGGLKPVEDTYHGPLPAINKPGQTPAVVPQVTPQGAPVAPTPASAADAVNANANRAIPLADEYDTGAKSADLVDTDTRSPREVRRDTVIDSLLRDENDPDPAKAEFNRRWNEKTREARVELTNKAEPFGGMGNKEIEADIYNEVKGGASRAADVDLSTLSDEELAASKAKLEKELKDLDAESKKTEQILAEARAAREQATSAAPAPPQSAVATETYDHGAGVSKATASGEVLVESPPPKPPSATISQRKLDAIEEMAANGTNEEKEIAKKKLEELRRSGRVPRRGPGDIGKPADDIRTRPSSRGADAASTTTTTTPKPPPTNGSVAMDPPKVTTAPPSSGAPSKYKTLLDDAAEAARNVARGHGNAKALGIAGAAALLGVGYASTKSKKSVNREDGTYMDQSRRDLGY
jgi:hypothetical protein